MSKKEGDTCLEGGRHYPKSGLGFEVTSVLIRLRGGISILSSAVTASEILSKIS